MKPGNQFNGFKFDERTNIGAAENSQGTLFHVDRGRDQKGPKGFSPERQDQVRQMVAPDPEEAPYLESGSRISVRNLPGRTAELEPSGRLSPKGRGTVKANARLVQDMVSRSTIPDLHPDQQTRIIVHGADEPIPGATGSGVVGMYNPPKYGVPHTVRVLDRAVVTPEGRSGGSPTLTHEMGHRDSFIKGNDSAQYDTPERQGREEAYADDFAVNHTRGFGDKKMTHTPAYPTPQRLVGSRAGADWERSYRNNRTTPMSAPDPYITNAKHGEQLPLLYKATSSVFDNAPSRLTVEPGGQKYRWTYVGKTGMPSPKPGYKDNN